MILDTGVFIALDNPSRRRIILELVKKMRAEGSTPVTTDGVLAQSWRDPATQIPMTLLLKLTEVYPFGNPKAIGLRCASSGTSDVVDASLAVLSDQLELPILTTDPDDMAALGTSFLAL